MQILQQRQVVQGCTWVWKKNYWHMIKRVLMQNEFATQTMVCAGIFCTSMLLVELCANKMHPFCVIKCIFLRDH